MFHKGAQSLLSSAQSALNEGRFSQAYRCYLQAYRHTLSTESSHVLRTACQQAVSILTQTGHDPHQLISLLLSLRREIQNYDDLVVLDVAIADIYRQRNHLSTALRYNTKALKHATDSNKAVVLLSMSVTLYALQDSARGHKYANRGYQLALQELRTDKSRLVEIAQRCEELGKLQTQIMELEWKKRAISLLETYGNSQHSSYLVELQRSLYHSIRKNRGEKTDLPSLQTKRSGCFSVDLYQPDSVKTADSLDFTCRIPVFLSQQTSRPPTHLGHSYGHFEQFSLPTISSLHSQASIIQRIFRRKQAWLTLQERRLILHKHHPLVLRTGKTLQNEYFLVSVFRWSGGYEVEAIGTKNCSRLFIPLPCSIPLTQVGDVLDMDRGKRLYRKDEDTAARRIQTYVRGVLTRIRWKQRKFGRNTGVWRRECIHIDGKYCMVVLLEVRGQTVLRSDLGDLEVPGDLTCWSDIRKHLKIADNRLYFEDFLGKTGNSHALSDSICEKRRKKEAAVSIQRFFRGFLARRTKIMPKSRRFQLLYRSCKRLSSDVLAVVTLHSDNAYLVIEAVDILKKTPYQGLISLSDQSLSAPKPLDFVDIFNRLALNHSQELVVTPALREIQHAAITIQKIVKGVQARGRYRVLKRHNPWRLQVVGQKLVDGEVFHLAIYTQAEKVKVELFKLLTKKELKYRSQYYSLDVKELFVIYGHFPAWDQLISDLYIHEGHLSIQQCISSTASRTTSSLRHSSTEAYKRKYEVKTTRRFNGHIYVVTMSMRTEDIVEFRAFEAGGREFTVTASLQQLAVKCELSIHQVRPIGSTTIHKLLKLTDGVLYIDFNAKLIDFWRLMVRIQACVRGFLVRQRSTQSFTGNLITCQVVSLAGSDWVMYAYRESPRIHLQAIKRRTNIHSHGYFEESVLVGLPPTVSIKQAIERLIFPRVELVSTAEGSKLRIVEIGSNYTGNSAFCLFKSVVFKALINLKSAASPVKTEAKKEEKLVLRTSLEVGGYFCLVSIYQLTHSLLIQVENHKTHLHLTKNVQIDRSLPIESQCESLLSQLDIKLERTGQPELLLVDKKAGFLHRCSQYLSEKLYHITVRKGESGVMVEALDSVTNAVLRLGTSLQDTSEREIGRLLERLQVKEGELQLDD